MASRKNPLYNSEGYYDPTFYYATKDIIKEESKEAKKVHRLINELKDLAEDEGFTIENRIVLKDKKTGKVFK